METCCESLIKYFMIICNIIFALIGVILIGFGAYAQIEAKDYLNFLGDNYVNTPIFIIILGAVIFVISFFGCCGACQENKCMMYMYGFLLFCILIAQIGAGIAAFALKGDLKEEIETNMQNGLKLYDTDGTAADAFTTTWDLVQQNVDCCGVKTWGDWSVRYNETSPTAQVVPDSCCIEGIVEGCGAKPQFDESKIFKDGCFNKFSDMFTDNLGVVGGVAVGVALAELLIVFISCAMGKRMGHNSQYV